MVEILYGLAGSAFSKIIEARDDNQAASRFVQCESDVAKISVRDVLQFGERPGAPQANHRAPGIELAVERFNVRGSLRLGERNVNGGKNTACQRQQVSGENNLRLRQTSVLENFRRVTMVEETVSLEIFIHFDEVQVTARIFAGAAGAGLAVANDAGAGSKPACLSQRPQGKNHAGRITARICNQTSLGNFARIELRNTVDSFPKPFGVRRGQLVPGCKGFRFAKAECCAQIYHRKTGLDQGGGQFHGKFVGGRKKSGAPAAANGGPKPKRCERRPGPRPGIWGEGGGALSA